jgi:hypothetical protein
VQTQAPAAAAARTLYRLVSFISEMVCMLSLGCNPAAANEKESTISSHVLLAAPWGQQTCKVVACHRYLTQKQLLCPTPQGPTCAAAAAAAAAAKPYSILCMCLPKLTVNIANSLWPYCADQLVCDLTCCTPFGWCWRLWGWSSSRGPSSRWAGWPNSIEADSAA